MTKNFYIFVFACVLMYVLFIVDKKVFNIKPVYRRYVKPHLNQIIDNNIIQRNNDEYLRDKDRMRAIVLKNKPTLSNNAITDIQRVNIIREWVNEQSVWGGKNTNINVYRLLVNKTALQMLDFINITSTGLDCGTYTVFLLKLYHLFGYDSYVYDMGRDSEGGHSVVLVWINDNGKRKLIVEDPTYNITYIDSDGVPIDFFVLLQKIKDKQESEIKMSANMGLGHKEVCMASDACNTLEGKEWIGGGGMLMHRSRFDTNSVRGNLPIFLYSRFIRYYDTIGISTSLTRLMDFFIIKLKMTSFVEFAS